MIWPARRVPQAEVVAVAARDGERARDYAKQHGIARSYGSYEALLADPDIDAVYVGLPNGLHGHWTRAALKAGKHVLCEKPFTANEEEAREVQALARSRGLVCREAFHYREHPLMEHLHRLLGSMSSLCTDSSPKAVGKQQHLQQQQHHGKFHEEASGGVLGRLKSVDVAVLIPKWVFGGANIRFQETLAGGAAMDAGCYCIHAIRSLVGGQPTVESATAVMAPKSQVVDAAMSGTLRWREGSNAGLHASFRASLQHDGLFPISTIDVRGDKGHLHCSNFIMPVFGNVVRLTTTSPAVESGAGSNSIGNGSNKTTTTVTRVYGSGESTYFYQLSRFVRDVGTVKDAAKDDDAGALVAASTILADDAADSIANMHLLDEVYLAAGLAPRLPSSQSARKQQAKQAGVQ
ncbi:hypothetical protein VOLCADRAFT_118462 [Volvox carteri f. nagariensis]|uniref:D-xylose 1-dehydrogenase (NADP(+), D-xylono-1,5-lactone-forming) n=1 Tax=Volvox carteri f. nagariensis TaxID=3068 RepID=D8U532_VOLCA|nr:uncharacterized protein VOLCADRAFT_118462 [Volvox carteri f. nagariensis]EFJ45147.1 hypothetical protein VOLCADRAFT_118462 [Volvox carteri f. nagariensis]|eukprot:XP_002953823.1 hypothetical protein VOLCADRAFT_118462 [Volvox carteri f. nagariensis]